MNIFTKFHKNQTENVDVLLLANFVRVWLFFTQTLDLVEAYMCSLRSFVFLDGLANPSSCFESQVLGPEK